MCLALSFSILLARLGEGERRSRDIVQRNSAPDPGWLPLALELVKDTDECVHEINEVS